MTNLALVTSDIELGEKSSGVEHMFIFNFTILVKNKKNFSINFLKIVTVLVDA